MLYVDTSVFVTAFTTEAGSYRMQDWLAAQNIEELTTSEWTITEFSSALSVKLTTKQIEIFHRNSALALFAHMTRSSLKILQITGTHFRSAAQLADQYALGIRAGDALHLAVAIDHNATLCTLDKRLAEGGRTTGASTRLL
jgi:uncharacterized protein